MDINKMIFTFTTLSKNGDIKDIKNDLDILQIETLARNIDRNLFDYNIEFKNKYQKVKKK